MSELKKEWYIDSKKLENEADFILETLPENFKDVFNCNFKIFFTTRDPSQKHYAGFCRKLDKAIQFRTGLQFLILIYKPYWDEIETPERMKILIHELHHIQVDEEEDDEGYVELKYKLRKHNEKEDFCELPSHDKYSEHVYQLLAEATTPRLKGRPALLLE